jgi:hypothetical protein
MHRRARKRVGRWEPIKILPAVSSEVALTLTNNLTHKYINKSTMPTHTQEPAMIVPHIWSRRRPLQPTDCVLLPLHGSARLRRYFDPTCDIRVGCAREVLFLAWFSRPVGRVGITRFSTIFGVVQS